MSPRAPLLIVIMLATAGVAAMVFWRSGADKNQRSVAQVDAAPVPEAPSTRGAAGETVLRPAEPPRATAPSPRRDAPPMEEAQLMSRLRSVATSDVALALELAREGNRRFPESDSAPERTSILIHALASLGRGSEARGEAEGMVNHYPDSDWVREIEGFTGAHRHRDVFVTDAGLIQLK